MIRLRIISAIIILTSLIACDGPLATFSDPQPIEIDNLTKIPKRLQGQYLNLTDNSKLIIDDQQIQRIYDFDIKGHRNQLDSNTRIFGDTLIDLETKKKSLVKFDGDSVIIHQHQIDTLFHFDNDNVIRKFKGYYFVSTRYDKENWEVQKLQLSKGQLVMSSISTKLDIDNLKAITETTQDTISPYKFQMTKKQFNEFIENDGFRDSKTFVKQK